MLLGLAAPTAGLGTIGGKRYSELAAPARTVGAVIPALNKGYAFLPGPAAGALVGSNVPTVGGVALTSLEGGLVLLGWGILVAVCGWLFTMRLDIP
jgi:hypothetical protein